MNTTLIATAAGLATAVLWGVADWLTPRSKSKLTYWQINFVVSLAGASLLLLIAALTQPRLPTAHQALVAVLASALICSGYLLFVKALTIGAVGVIVPLSSIYPMVTLVLSIIFEQTVFAGHQIIAMILIVLGAVFLAYEKNDQKLPLRKLHEANLLTFIAIMLWGVGFFVLNPLVSKVDWRVLNFILEFTGLIIATILMVAVYRRGTAIAIKRGVANSTAWQAGLMLSLGTAALYMGAGRIGNIILPAVIASLSPLLAAGLEWKIDGKSLGLIKRAGAVIAVGGIVLLNL